MFEKYETGIGQKRESQNQYSSNSIPLVFPAMGIQWHEPLAVLRLVLEAVSVSSSNHFQNPEEGCFVLAFLCPALLGEKKMGCPVLRGALLIFEYLQIYEPACVIRSHTTYTALPSNLSLPFLWAYATVAAIGIPQIIDPLHRNRRKATKKQMC